MEQILHIGAKVEKEAVENFTKAIAEIFTSAYNNHMDQATVRKAINAFSNAFNVDNVTVTNSSFVGEDKRVTVSQNEDD